MNADRRRRLGSAPPRTPGSGRRRGIQVLALVLAAVSVAYCTYAFGSFFGDTASGQVVGSRNGPSEALGYDSCEPLPVKKTLEQWSTTGFAYIGTYLGGITATKEVGCLIEPKSFYSEVHVEHEHREAGFDFLPIWDGRQDPCGGFEYTFSEDPSENYLAARNQAVAEVNAAVAAAETRGFLTNPGSIFYYDLEGFGGIDTEEHPHCVEAAKAFVNVWVKRLHEVYATPAGLYGSASSSNMKAYWNIANPPNDAWISQTGIPKSVYAVYTEYVPESYWPSRRFHQYLENEVYFYEGKEYKRDLDCAYGLVAGWGESKAEPECHAK